MQPRFAVAAALAFGPAAYAQQSVSIDLAGLQIRHGVDQMRSSAPATISPAYRYEYRIDGMVRGMGGVLGLLFPNPTPLAQVLETLSPGASAALNGGADNCAGTHPVGIPPTMQSGSQTILGLNVNYALTLTVGIDAANVARFSLTDVTLSPSALTGYLTFQSGTVTVTRLYHCPANCDASTVAPVLNINDFICFQTRFAAGETEANCDCSTTEPILNVNDFVCFMGRFAGGCSPE